MYSEAALLQRKCTGINKDGSPCRAFALWGSNDQKCRRHTKDTKQQRLITVTKTVCHCNAYAWPHRPGSGLCRWPEQPAQRSTTPAGTHKRPRNRPPRFVTVFSFDSRRDPLEKLERWLDEQRSNQ